MKFHHRGVSSEWKQRHPLGVGFPRAHQTRGVFASSQNSYRGFSMVSAVISLSIMWSSMLVFVSMMVDQQKETKFLKQQLVSTTLKPLIIRSLVNSGNCNCHFDRDQNTSAVSLNINTTSPTAHEIDLRTIRVGCDFSSSDNILISAGTEIKEGEGLSVSSVKVSNIKYTGTTDLYSGDLIIQYGSTGRILRPLSIPLIFFVDSSKGTSTARPIQACWGGDGQGKPKECYTIAEKNSDGRTLVGCGNTSNIPKETTTAFGFGAGAVNQGGGNIFVGYKSGMSNTTGFGNTIMGFQAGLGHTMGTENTIMGHQAGESNTTGALNIFIGYQSGKLNREGEKNYFIGNLAGNQNRNGSDNIFMGYQAGLSGLNSYKNIFMGSYSGANNNSSYNNTFIGVLSGKNITTGKNNTFIGPFSGEAITSGEKNTFIGSQAGLKNTVGNENTFIGLTAGSHSTNSSRHTFVGFYSGKFNTIGRDNTYVGQFSGGGHTTPYSSGNGNTFIGSGAGQSITSGSANTFIGYFSGKDNSNGRENTFIGNRAGARNQSGNKNLFIGQGTGESTERGTDNVFIGNQTRFRHQRGNHNIVIGSKAGASLGISMDYKFVVGNEVNTEWLMGDMTSTGNLRVNGRPVMVTSSRVLKKNIRPFKDLKGALADLLKTPLFTYQYKTTWDHPEKKRMGIIAEELPDHLQIQEEGQFSHPDWPSIYGSLWAGIKALYEMLENLKHEISSGVESLRDRLGEFKNKRGKLVKNLFYAKKELYEKKKRLNQAYKDLEDIKKDFAETRAFFQQQLNEIVKRLSLMKKGEL